MRHSRALKSLGMTAFAILLVASRVSAADKTDGANVKAKATSSKKSAAATLCDDNWNGRFLSIAVDRVAYDEKTTVLKDYDPNKPEDVWVVPEGRYLRLGYFSDVDRRNRGLPPNRVIKLIGRFHAEKEAEAFLRRVHSDSKFSRHLNPAFPADIVGTGALLVSEKYTCTLSKENDVLGKADWIVEVDGHLFAGAESTCKQGKKKKSVSVLDCAGNKALATDTWSAPCDASISACLLPMGPGTVAIRQDYSASEEGRQTSFRVYDFDSGRQLAKFTGGGDWAIGRSTFRDFDDKDGDGVPEIVDTECTGADQCKEVRVRKWKKDRFVDVKAAP